jgi:V/A-type H+-transporting ATPase subunit E
MKSLESGKDKMQKICDVLRKETLEPAKQEASEVIENAHIQAAEIVREAKEKVKGLLQAASTEIEQKKKAFESTLQIACRQGVESLKQKIEKELLYNELAQHVEKETSDPKFLSTMINSFLQALEEKGVDEVISVVVPKSITPRSVNTLLAERFLERLKQNSVVLGDFDGGIQIKLLDRKITIDISDRVIRELISDYIRGDFRELIFRV